MGGFFDLGDERGVLRLSIAVTLAIAALGVGFGLASGSFSIVFDGVYSLVDASMSLLSLVVVNLIASYALAGPAGGRLRRRFSVGFWHLEPMVLALKGTLLIAVAVYALVTAIGSIIEGGRELEFGLAITYAVITLAICVATAVVEHRANRAIGSDFVRLDVKGWIMSSGITAALLAAFAVGYAVAGTRWEWVSPYLDPAVLALVCLIIIPIPIATIRRALADILLIAPAELSRRVETAAAAFCARHGFVAHRAYVARVGRSRMIELYFIVPPEAPARPLSHWDGLREEFGAEIGGEGPDRWLTIVFTGDPQWAE